MSTSLELPAAIAGYRATVEAKDWEALTQCFTSGATVFDEGRTHVGRDAIRAWRSEAAAKYTYTEVVTGTEQPAGDRFLVNVHLEGDFPGGVVDLTQDFTLQDGLISELRFS
jgi:ketosteroid isomerase-like protein